jgi:phage tail protein X
MTAVKTSYEVITVTGEGLTLSRLVWNRFHQPVPGLVEKIMDLNTNIADFGEYMPVGFEITVPIEPSLSDVAPVERIALWD